MFVCIYLRGTVLMTTTSLNDRSRRNITTPPSQAKHPPLQWLSIVPLNTCNSECCWIIAATTTAMATTSFLRWFLSLLIIYPIHITLYICSYAILNIHLCVATYNPMCLWYKRLYAFSFHFICPTCTHTTVASLRVSNGLHAADTQLTIVYYCCL